MVKQREYNGVKEFRPFVCKIINSINRVMDLLQTFEFEYYFTPKKKVLIYYKPQREVSKTLLNCFPLRVKNIFLPAYSR